MFQNLRLRTKLIIIVLFASVPMLVIGYFSVFQINQIASPIKSEVPGLIQDIYQKTTLNNSAQLIRYYDEVLTQAARNYAFTRNKKWENIYNETVSKLDANIKFALESGDLQDKKFFSEVDSANLALVDMEKRSMDFVDQGQASSAMNILESDEYWKQKNIYKIGLDRYASRRSLEGGKTIALSLDSLTAINNKIDNIVRFSLVFIFLFVSVFFLSIVVLGMILINSFTRRTKNLLKITEGIANGNFSQRSADNYRDEVGQLGRALNIMADKLQSSRDILEKKIKERTKELEKSGNETKKTLNEAERLNKLMIGRELEMVKLKKEIISLKKNIEK